MTSEMKKSKIIFYLIAFIGTTFVGFAPLFVRSVQVGPITAGFYRICFALPFLAIWMGLESVKIEKKAFSRNEWLCLIAYGLLFSLDITFWNLSVHYTTIVNASLFNNFAAFFVPLIVWVIFRARPSWRFVQGAAIALIGSLLLVSGNFKLSAQTLIGDGLALISAICYASYLVVIKNLRSRFGPGTILFFGGLFALGSLSLLAFFEGGLHLPGSLDQTLLLVGFALFSQVAGQGLIALSMGRLSSSMTGLILLTQPVSSALLAYVLFDEPVSLMCALGGALILFSLYLVQRDKSRSFESH